MTLPDERFRAVIQTKNFLQDLLDTKKTPRIPRRLREQAYSLLRHYPSYWDLERAGQAAPEVFQPQMEPVTRMFLQYQLNKQKENTDDLRDTGLEP